MPRTGSTYNLPAGSIVQDGVDDILASQHNTPLLDIAEDLNHPRPIAAGGTGATSASGARTNLGIGGMATQAPDNVAITGGSITATIDAATITDTDLTDGDNVFPDWEPADITLTGPGLVGRSAAGAGAAGLIPFSEIGLPVGSVIHVAQNTAPEGFLKANGAAVSRSTYAALFDAIGTTFGPGNGSTTFNLPDLRGEFLRGWDDGRGVDSGRSFGTAQLDQMQRITGQFNRWRDGTAPMRDDGAAGAGVDISGAFVAGGTETNGTSERSGTGRQLHFDSAQSPDARTSSTTSGETRARNVALLACIKY